MKSLRKARELARKLEMPYEEGLAMYELGKHTANSAEAGRLFSGALDRFVDAGALYDVERCRHASARAPPLAAQSRLDDLLRLDVRPPLARQRRLAARHRGRGGGRRRGAMGRGAPRARLAVRGGADGGGLGCLAGFN